MAVHWVLIIPLVVNGTTHAEKYDKKFDTAYECRDWAMSHDLWFERSACVTDAVYSTPSPINRTPKPGGAYRR